MDISKINPWVDPAPSKERDMRLNQIRQQIKKKKPWAYRYLAQRYTVGGRGLKRSMKKAIENFKKGITLGDPVCMTALGDVYKTGLGVNKNEKLAFEHYQMAAFKGLDRGQNNVGSYYYKGYYVEKNNTKAREWWNKAAAQGYKAAIESLKYMDKEVEEKEEAEEKKAKKESTEQIIQEETIKPERSRASIPKTSTNVNNSKDGRGLSNTYHLL